MTMNPKLIFFSIIMLLFIGCDSIRENKFITPPSEICPDSESMGCDDNCSTTPLENDACGICDGDGSTCEGKWNVFYDGSVPISGFQFNIDGASGISASGGAAEAAGFMVSTGSTTVIGFSLSGSTIPPGTGTLTSLEIAGNSNLFCISNLVLSDIGGGSIAATIEDCNTIKYSD